VVVVRERRETQRDVAFAYSLGHSGGHAIGARRDAHDFVRRRAAGVYGVTFYSKGGEI